MSKARRLAGVMAGTVLFTRGGTASAATLKAHYDLQGSRASQVAGAPELRDLGPGNRFVTETLDGADRQVLAFPRGGGLALHTRGLVDPGRHSIVMVLRVTETRDFRRLLDWRARCGDGRVRESTVELGATRIRDGRFSVRGGTRRGGAARVAGLLRGRRASGSLSRRGAGRFGTTCRASGVRWRARLPRDRD